MRYKNIYSNFPRAKALGDVSRILPRSELFAMPGKNSNPLHGVSTGEYDPKRKKKENIHHLITADNFSALVGRPWRCLLQLATTQIFQSATVLPTGRRLLLWMKPSPNARDYRMKKE